MFDIWPDEKNVHLPEGFWDALSTIGSRAITVLIVPSRQISTMESTEGNRERAILESLRRSIRVCYAYSHGGTVESGDLIVSCTNEDVREWGTAVLDSIPEQEHFEHKQMWNGSFVDGSLTQSFERISLDQALASLSQSSGTVT